MTDMFERFTPEQLEAYIARTRAELADCAPLPGLTWDESESLLSELLETCRAELRRRTERLDDVVFAARVGIGLEILDAASGRIGIMAAQQALHRWAATSARGPDVYRESLARWAEHRLAFAVYCRARRDDGTVEQQTRWVLARNARAAREQVERDGPTVYGILEPMANGATKTDRFVIVEDAAVYFVFDSWVAEPHTSANAKAELDQLTSDMFDAHD